MSATAVILGRIVKAVGLKGEVKLQPSPDFWERVLEADNLELAGKDGRRRVSVESTRSKKRSYILKLSGIETIDDAEAAVGKTLEVVLDDLEDDQQPQRALPCQMMGFVVLLSDGTKVGTVTDMLLGPAQRSFIVERDGERMIVPEVPEVVLAIDFEKGTIEIDPPEGLLELRW